MRQVKSLLFRKFYDVFIYYIVKEVAVSLETLKIFSSFISYLKLVTVLTTVLHVCPDVQQLNILALLWKKET